MYAVLVVVVVEDMVFIVVVEACRWVVIVVVVGGWEVGVVDLVVGVVVKVGGRCGAMVFWVTGMWLGW